MLLVGKYAICEKFKRTNKPKYGKFPFKVAEVKLSVEVHVDIIGPYTVKTKRNEIFRVMVVKGEAISFKNLGLRFKNESDDWFELHTLQKEFGYCFKFHATMEHLN